MVDLIISGRIGSGNPTLGEGIELDAIAAAVIGGASLAGGVGTVWGAVVGAMIIGSMNTGLDLLNDALSDAVPKLDKLALERNARLLENVLDDFNVKGEITAVRTGPVVTMYELEPAPGIYVHQA